MRLLKNDPGSIWHQTDFVPNFGNHNKSFGMGYVCDYVDQEWSSVGHRDDLTCSYDPKRIK